MGKEVIIDGKDATLGRLASYAAKQSLLGKKVIIVNAEDVVIVGDKRMILEKYSNLVKKGGHSLKGPKIIRTPERILKRTVRGMLSHKQTRGSDAIKRVICHNEIPEEYKESKKIKAGREKKGKFLTLKQLAGLLN